MNFSSDPYKQAQETRKAEEISHPPSVLNNIIVSQSSSRKHMGVILNSKLIFDEYLKMASLKNKQNPWTSPKIVIPITKIQTNYNV